MLWSCGLQSALLGQSGSDKTAPRTLGWLLNAPKKFNFQAPTLQRALNPKSQRPNSQPEVSQDLRTTDSDCWQNTVNSSYTMKFWHCARRERVGKRKLSMVVLVAVHALARLWLQMLQKSTSTNAPSEIQMPHSMADKKTNAVTTPLFVGKCQSYAHIAVWG